MVSQGVTCCSGCDCILEGIKYICTTCGEKTPTPRSTLIAAAVAAEDSEKGKGRESSNSPTQTVLARRFSESSSSTARVGYELCGTCFEQVGVDHSLASGINMNGSSRTTPTPKELGIARRTPPKQDGKLRHAFVEQFWYDNRWEDVGARLLVV